jgi:wyosine [tRNA(Phe)-imidazoG37] synthetase (radical SAM superfamily)
MSRQPVSFAFGPVPSRRLGRSVGINNVRTKACSYSCLYCQVGPTPIKETEPRRLHPPEELVAAVGHHVRALRERGEPIDFLTFVADGEPTLDRHLGEEIDGLRPLGLPIAVISNGSLLWRDEVREALARADWVSLKVDAGDAPTWRMVNRPHPSLRLEVVLDGMLRFAGGYRGRLVTETMLLQDENSGEAAIAATAAVLERLQPRIAYVAIPTRPPAARRARPADEEALNRAFQCFAGRLPRVEFLTGFEGTAFGTTGGPVDDLLAITAVHPMREDAALALLAQGGHDRARLEALVAEARLRRVDYRGETFYIRRLAPKQGGAR